MPSLDSSRSTCLVACLVARPRAAARPSPMAETASEALCSTPIVALHRLSTRLACRSCSNTLPSTRCTASNENRLMSATWGLMTCSARFVGCLRGRLVKTRWGESGLAKLQCYCVMAASPILFGNHGSAGDSIIPTLVREQNEGIHKVWTLWSDDARLLWHGQGQCPSLPVPRRRCSCRCGTVYRDRW